ncbi:MAG TPA: TMEM165/GDT1 family protein [Burkholderiales bacterium]|nr:TMEM165/GDT1 family protein [Burkholderiales bacterium]
MEAFLVSAGIVAIGEIGDKTQLLALMLAARFRRPVPIVLGIFCATLANHAAAGAVGGLARALASPEVLRWGMGLSFLAIAIWALFPDRVDEAEAAATSRLGVFALTVATFFLAEIGDKTQIATVVLAARYDSLVAVVAGTTCGMLLADVPAVLLGQAAAPKVPLKAVRMVAAALFALMGAGAIAGFNIL